MNNFNMLNMENALEESRSLLEASQKGFGMIPILHTVIAASPQIFEGYQIIHNVFQNAFFNNAELTLV